MGAKVTLILMAVMVAYLCLGGLVFFLLERDREENVGKQMQGIVDRFLAQNPELAAANVSKFLQSMSAALSAGYELNANGTVLLPAPRWDYHSSLFFSITVVTTIGYGNISPVTTGGRVFFVLFALFGIPLLAVLLGKIMNHFRVGKAKLEAAVVSRCGCCCGGREASSRTIALLGSIVFMLTGSVLLLLLPALAFSFIEGWYFGEAMYYVFVTLSTVGFGDYVAGQNVNSPIFKLLLVMWIFCGLLFVSEIISCVQSVIESKAAVVDGSGEAETGDQPEGDSAEGEAKGEAQGEAQGEAASSRGAGDGEGKPSEQGYDISLQELGH